MDGVVAFCSPRDRKQQVVTFVDRLRGEHSSRMDYVLLHEVSHAVSKTRDFIYVPLRQSAKAALEHFNRALKNANDLFPIRIDDIFRQAYIHFMRELYHFDIRFPIPNDGFLQLLRRDKMFKTNVMMENANYVAIIKCQGF